MLQRCSEIDGLKTVAITALGTGYGNMEIEDFVELFYETGIPDPLDTLELIIPSDIFFREARLLADRLEKQVQVIG